LGSPPPAPGANLHLVGAFSYLRDLTLYADLTEAVGDKLETENTQKRLSAMKDEFNSAFYDSNNKVYGSGLQTENAMGLWLNCPATQADKDMVLQNMIKDIMVTHGVHPTTGILGWKFMLEALTMHGHSEIGIALNQQDTYPSIGYMIQGMGNPEPATTVWELWDSPTEGPGMNSRNHIMFGSVGSWLYKALLGFSADGATIGLGPEFSVVNVNNITSASGQTRTPFGTVEVDWFIASSSSCAIANEQETATVACPSGVITSVDAFYGTPTGSCSTGFKAGSCNSSNAYADVYKACIGKASCSIPVSNDYFGGDPCLNTVKHFSMTVTCSTASSNPTFSLRVTVPVGQNNTMVNIPIVPNLKQSSQNIRITEGTTEVWSNSKYVPGTPGVYAASLNPSGQGITVTVGAGNYKFAATAV